MGGSSGSPFLHHNLNHRIRRSVQVILLRHHLLACSALGILYSVLGTMQSASAENSSAQPTLHKRSALACLPCRTAKNKCDGVPPPLIVELSSHLETKIPTGDDVQLRSDTACTRCARLHLECLWQPSHRTGRPRKRARVQEAPICAPSSSMAQASSHSGPSANGEGSRDQNYPDQHSAFEDNAAMMMDLLEQSQRQPQPDDPMDFSAMSSLQLSESDLMALLNESPFDSSKAAIESDHDFEPVPSESQAFEASGLADDGRAPPFNAYSPLDHPPAQLITSLDQILPLQCLQQEVQQAPALPLATSSPETSRAVSSRARDHLSALRARLNPVARSVSPPRATPAEVPSTLHLADAKQHILRYIQRTESDPSIDDTVDAAVLDNGLKLYFSGFAKTVPLLGDVAEFQASVLNALPHHNSARRLLTRTVAALGYLVSTANLVTARERSLLLQRLRSEAQILLGTTLDRVGSHPSIRLNDVEALATLQALVLLAYDSYGQNLLVEAESRMRAALNLALRMRLNQIDAPSPSDVAQNSIYSNAGTQTVSMAHGAISNAHSESLRRVWWELYLCDLMFTVTTSGKIARCIDTASLEVAVHTPIDPGYSHRLGRSTENMVLKAEPHTSSDAGLDQRQALSQAYDVRIRTCALIHECVKPPEDPENPDFERIRAIDTMLSNIMVVAQRHWANASTAIPAASQNGEYGEMERVRWANDTRIEILFTAMTMLHASRIHLHRLAWFHDLTMDFTSCSFKKFDSTVQIPLTSGATSAEHSARRRALLSTSVTRIVSSADAIMRLVRLDQRMASPSTWTNTAFSGADAQAYVAGRLPAHWPFLGCCNMVAAFGYVVAVAASGPDESNLPTYGDEIRLYDDVDDGPMLSSPAASYQNHSPPGADATTPSATDPTSAPPPNSALSVRKKRDAMVWKLRAAISNIGFAESTLAQYAHIWPICAVYQHEVALCRNAIDSTGPTGLQ